jgi:hypothetical protein
MIHPSIARATVLTSTAVTNWMAAIVVMVAIQARIDCDGCLSEKRGHTVAIHDSDAARAARVPYM